MFNRGQDGSCDGWLAWQPAWLPNIEFHLSIYNIIKRIIFFVKKIKKITSMDEKVDKSIIVEIGRYREKDENVYTLNIFIFLCVLYILTSHQVLSSPFSV